MDGEGCCIYKNNDELRHVMLYAFTFNHKMYDTY